MDTPALHAGARVTVAYASAFAFSVLVQLVAKRRAAMAYREAKKRGELPPDARFNRYDVAGADDALIAADRGVGNTLEWSPWFLSLFWADLAVAGPAVAVPWGWAYVAARFAYPVLAQLGGVTRGGPRPLIFLSTVPGYAALLRLSLDVVRVAGFPWPEFGGFV